MNSGQHDLIKGAMIIDPEAFRTSSRETMARAARRQDALEKASAVLALLPRPDHACFECETPLIGPLCPKCNSPAQGDGDWVTVPAGWKLVPEEPTQAMLEACGTAWTPTMQMMWPKIITDIYRQFLAAAPPSPAAPGGWRPIAEAPRDGTRVLMRTSSGQMPVEIMAYDGPSDGAIYAGSASVYNWANDAGAHAHDNALLGWMPLPQGETP